MENYIGEIRMFAGNYAPVGWALCSGQLLSIPQYGTLFSLIGTTYGGDGQNTFALPDLRGRVPIGQGTGAGLPSYQMGQYGGSENVTLTGDQMPVHTHAVQATSAAGTSNSPQNAVWADSGIKQYSTNQPPNAQMNATALGRAGNGQPHDNMMPFETINFIIALEGTFPSRP